MDRVLEIGGFAAGYCGRMFVQAGCEVVRVAAASLAPSEHGSTALDVYLHDGKRHIQTDDLKIIGELADRADVVVAETPTAEGLLDLGFDDWRAPVKAAITPFGRTGPKSNWSATPGTLLAMGGYTYLMGDSDRAPLTLPGHYAEFQSGGFAYLAANASRLAGEENVIDVGMFESVMALSQFTTVLWTCAGEIRSRHGNDFLYASPSNLYRCADGCVYINITRDFWDALAAAVDRPELVIDPRFETNAGRMANREALHEILDEAFASLSTAEVLARATEYRFPCGELKTFDEVLQDPHLAERDFWQQVDGAYGRVASPRIGWRMDGSSPRPADISEREQRHG